jgi:hypothetical protein
MVPHDQVSRPCKAEAQIVQGGGAQSSMVLLRLDQLTGIRCRACVRSTEIGLFHVTIVDEQLGASLSRYQVRLGSSSSPRRSA